MGGPGKGQGGAGCLATAYGVQFVVWVGRGPREKRDGVSGFHLANAASELAVQRGGGFNIGKMAPV